MNLQVALLAWYTSLQMLEDVLFEETEISSFTGTMVFEEEEMNEQQNKTKTESSIAQLGESNMNIGSATDTMLLYTSAM